MGGNESEDGGTLLEKAGAFRCLRAVTLAVGLELPRLWKLLVVDRVFCEFWGAGPKNNQRQTVSSGMGPDLTSM